MATKSLGTTFFFTPQDGAAVSVGMLSSVGEITCDSEMIDITTLDAADGCRHYIQGAKDAGEIRLTGYHRKNDEGQQALRSAYASGETGTARIAFPDGAAVSFPALVKSHTLGASQVDGAIGFSCVLRVNGAVTVTLS